MGDGTTANNNNSQGEGLTSQRTWKSAVIKNPDAVSPMCTQLYFDSTNFHVAVLKFDLNFQTGVKTNLLRVDHFRLDDISTVTTTGVQQQHTFMSIEETARFIMFDMSHYIVADRMVDGTRLGIVLVDLAEQRTVVMQGIKL